MKKYLSVVLLLAVLLVPAVSKAQDQSVLASLVDSLQRLVMQLTEMQASQTAQTYSVGDKLKEFTPYVPPVTAINPRNIVEIDTWAELAAVHGGGHYKLTRDLSARTKGYDKYNGGEEGWVPLGSEANPFTGTFDGNGHVIKDLYINRSGGSGQSAENNQGLFGVISSDFDGVGTSTVKNLGLVDSEVIGLDAVGALAGRVKGGVVISNSYSSGTVNGRHNVGGLVGVAECLTPCGYRSVPEIVGSHSTARVSGWRTVGGLVGLLRGYEYDRARIITSYTSDDIADVGHYTVNADVVVGGLVGAVENGNIANSYSRKGVYSYGDDAFEIPNNAGGLVGTVASSTRIHNSYAAGRLRGRFLVQLPNIGGLVGRLTAFSTSTASGSFWDTDISGYTVSALGVGRTTAQMIDPTTYLNAGWDFARVWQQGADGYPTLR